MRSMYKQAGGLFASAAVVALTLIVLVSAFSAFIGREIGGVSMLFVAQAALAAALFLPAVLSKLGDHETLSVYREMAGQH